MKAVLWTDVFQSCIMLAGLIAVLEQGSKDAGGFSSIWQKMEENGRAQFLEYENFH